MARKGGMLALTLGAAVVACEDTHVLSGSYRSDAFWVADAPTPDAEDNDATAEAGLSNSPSLALAFQDLSLELVLGHFGPEVAGLAKFRKIRGLGTCPCAEIREGRYAGRRFTFWFEADFLPECLDLGRLEFRADFALREDGVLDGGEAGRLDVTAPGTPKTALVLHVLLARDREHEDLGTLDWSCEGFSRTESQ